MVPSLKLPSCLAFVFLVALVGFILNHLHLQWEEHQSQPLEHQATVLPQSADEWANRQERIAAEAAHDIAAGRVHAQDTLVPRELIQALSLDFQNIFDSSDSPFEVSGLSNTAKKEQDFNSRKDRYLASWLKLDGDLTGRPIGDHISRAKFLSAIRNVKGHLSSKLNRTLLQEDGEIMYSHYGIGTRLDVHFDEFHEELKGRKGWLLSQRRSITWLFFLNDDWDLDRDGGGLRTFTWKDDASCDWPVGSHASNVQVGWYRANHSAQRRSSPVFLATLDGDNLLSKLYYMNEGERQYISDLFPASQTDKDLGLKPYIFSQEQTHFFPLQREVAQSEVMQPRIVSPNAGTLALFDSVSVPHDVMLAHRPRRAIGGWFYEKIDMGLPTPEDNS